MAGLRRSRTGSIKAITPLKPGSIQAITQWLDSGCQRHERLGVPQSARDVFALIAQGGWIDAALADGLNGMVGFRNMPCAITESCGSPLR